MDLPHYIYSKTEKKLTANCSEAVKSVSRRYKRIGSSDFQPSLSTYSRNIVIPRHGESVLLFYWNPQNNSGRSKDRPELFYP